MCLRPGRLLQVVCAPGEPGCSSGGCPGLLGEWVGRGGEHPEPEGGQSGRSQGPRGNARQHQHPCTTRSSASAPRVVSVRSGGGGRRAVQQTGAEWRACARGGAVAAARMHAGPGWQTLRHRVALHHRIRVVSCAATGCARSLRSHDARGRTITAAAACASAAPRLPRGTAPHSAATLGAEAGTQWQPKQGPLLSRAVRAPALSLTEGAASAADSVS